MINGFRRTAAAAVTVLALGTGVAAWAASSASAAQAPAAITRCGASQLAVWVNADSADGTAGTTYYNLEYTNISHSTCSLYGYPGVSAIGANGKQLGKAADRNSETPARTVNIVPGGTAHSFLGYHDILLEPSCKPQDADILKVYAPNDTVAKHAFFDLSVCTKGQPMFSVERVQAGA